MLGERDNESTAEVDRAPDSRAVSQVLRGRGLSGQVIARRRTLSREMRRNSRRRGLEYATMVDADSGLPLGRLVSGQEGGVDIRAHLNALTPGRRYVQFHSHPSSSSFSDADAAILLSWPEINTVVVVGVDGSWYVLSRATPSPVSAREAVDAYWIEREAIDAEFGGWTRIAGDLGLRHERVQRKYHDPRRAPCPRRTRDQDG